MADRWIHRIVRVVSAIARDNAAVSPVFSRNLIRQVSILSLVIAGVVCPLQFDPAANEFSLAAVRAAQEGGDEGDEPGEDIGGYPEGEGSGNSTRAAGDERWNGEDGRFSRNAVDEGESSGLDQTPGGHLGDLNGLVPVSPEQEAGLLGKWGDE